MDSDRTLHRLAMESMAHGGDGVAHDDQGRAVFVRGAVPGDVVDAAVIEERRRHARAIAIRIVSPSAARVSPPCRHFGDCGGCQWQMASLDAQLAWKRDIVASQLRHIGSVDVPVEPVLSVGPPYGYRNRMDFRVVRGGPAMNRVRSHDPVTVSRCDLLVDALQKEFAGLGNMADGKLTLRAGVLTGETAVMRDGEHAVIHERVADTTFQIGGRAFFQVNTGGAEHLVRLVAEILSPTSTDILLDGYAGGGLFSATVGRVAGEVVAVESDPAGLADLSVNAPGIRVVAEPMERGLGSVDQVDLAVVDPPRQGLGASVVEGLVRLRPRRIASVSCDPASFARDARLLIDAGYRLESVQPLDLFPQTFHLEIVAAFDLDG